MKISILASAKNDLKDGFLFYEKQQVGLGRYFLSALRADIDSLQFFSGIHPVYANKFYRLLSRRFPYAIYYQVTGDLVKVYAVLDCRRKPAKTLGRLS